MSVTLLLFHSALSSQGLLSDAWKDAQNASNQTKADAGPNALVAIQKIIADLAKAIAARPDLTEEQTDCTQKKLTNLRQLLDIVDSSMPKLNDALKNGNKAEAALEYGKIKAARKKADEISRDSGICFGNDESNQPLVESIEEAALRTNVNVTDPGDSSVNGPNKPVIIPPSLATTQCASPPCTQ